MSPHLVDVPNAPEVLAEGATHGATLSLRRGICVARCQLLQLRRKGNLVRGIPGQLGLDPALQHGQQLFVRLWRAARANGLEATSPLDDLGLCPHHVGAIAPDKAHEVPLRKTSHSQPIQVAPVHVVVERRW